MLTTRSAMRILNTPERPDVGGHLINRTDIAWPTLPPLHTYIRFSLISSVNAICHILMQRNVICTVVLNSVHGSKLLSVTLGNLNCF